MENFDLLSFFFHRCLTCYMYLGYKVISQDLRCSGDSSMVESFNKTDVMVICEWACSKTHIYAIATTVNLDQSAIMQSDLDLHWYMSLMKPPSNYWSFLKTLESANMDKKTCSSR